MNKNNEKGVKGLANQLQFKYSDGNMGLYNSWDEMIDFWAPYYDSKADADRHFRRTAYGVTLLKDGAPIVQAACPGPLTANQKAELIDKTAAFLVSTIIFGWHNLDDVLNA